MREVADESAYRKRQVHRVIQPREVLGRQGEVSSGSQHQAGDGEYLQHGEDYRHGGGNIERNCSGVRGAQREAAVDQVGSDQGGYVRRDQGEQV